ncbi:MAG: AAA family ATPase [Acidobacteriota bacterium]
MKSARQTGKEIRLLGELQVLDGSRALPLPPSRRARALLGYLVVTGTPHLRETLCRLFWEGPDDPRGALRWALARLRPIVDDANRSRIVTDGGRVAFDAAGAGVDLATVTRTLSPGIDKVPTGELVSSAALFRGELLEGLDLADCYRFREWCVAERERARGARVEILKELVARLADRPEDALGFARHRLAVDPLQEESHVAVIDLLGRLGRRREALAQYDACRRILEVELGVRPSPALEQVRRAAATAAPPRAERPAAPPLPTPVATTLVGRGREIDALEDVVGGIGARASNAVLQISGDPGIGKTRLLGELAAIARRAGGVVLAGRAFEAEMVRPYGAWIEALRSLPPEVPAPPEDMAPLLEERGSGAPPEWDRSRLFRAFTGYLAALASKHPAVAVLLDDVQWLDEASAALLHFAARELDGCRVLIACAARPAELADNRPVHAMLRELARQGRLRALDVEALDAAATRELVGAVDAALDADRVYHDAGGNPLFTLELARALKDGATSLPDSLSGLIVDRLLRIEGRARDVLPWAAALGSSFDLAIVAAATALPPVEVAAAFEELERHAVIRPAGARYDFTHDLVRQGAYRQVSEPRRRLMHLTLARALSASGDAALAGDVAHHAALGGDREAAARACVAAARRCVRLFASVDAAALAERGRELSQDLPRELRAPIQLELIEIIMEARSKEWTVPRFETEIERLVLDAQSAGLPAWVQQGFYLLSQLHFQAGDFRGAHHATMQSTAAIEASDPGSAARTLAKSARCLALLGREHALAASHLLRADRPHARRASTFRTLRGRSASCATTRDASTNRSTSSNARTRRSPASSITGRTSSASPSSRPSISRPARRTASSRVAMRSIPSREPCPRGASSRSPRPCEPSRGSRSEIPGRRPRSSPRSVPCAPWTPRPSSRSPWRSLPSPTSRAGTSSSRADARRRPSRPRPSSIARRRSPARGPCSPACPSGRVTPGLRERSSRRHCRRLHS